MAKIIFTDGSEVRGSIGGKTYSRNASGAFVRAKITPVNKNTLKQQIARNAFASLSQAFRSLTAAQRSTFETMRSFYSRTDSIGNLVTPTAPQLFQRLNGVLLQNGIVDLTTLLTTCPAPVQLVSIAAAAPVYDVSDNSLFTTIGFNNGSSEVPSDQNVAVYATAAISNGVKSVPTSMFKKIKTLEAGDDTATTSIANNYIATFPAPAVGDAIWLKLVVYSTTTGQQASEVIVKLAIQA